MYDCKYGLRDALQCIARPMTAHVSHHLRDPGDYWALHISAFLGRVCEIQPIEEAKLKAWMNPDVSRHRYICMRVIHVIGTINSLLTVLCMCPQDALSRKALQHTFRPSIYCKLAACIPGAQDPGTTVMHMYLQLQ